MFDISWGEMLLIGGAALIFIGPKELPGTLRALGQMTAKVRRMAGEFRSQFDDAMREADVQSIRKEFDSMNDAAQSASSTFNPIQTIRDELKGAVDKPQEASSAAAPEPAIPAPDAPAPIDAASFDVKPAAPEPVVGSAPQPTEAASQDLSPAPAATAEAKPVAQKDHA